MYVGLAISIIANFLWFSIARETTQKETLYLYGFYWDSMIVLAYAAIPFLFYGVRVGMVQSLGLLLIIAGIILTKVSV
jgi:multidrug transporter EmrE-like cation transporter